MAVKSIIEIDVQDDAFKAFMDLFEKYQASLKKMPGAWKETENATGAVGKNLSDSTNKITATVNFIGKQVKEQEKMRREVERTNRSMTDLSRSTLRVASGIKDITMSLAKWGIGGFALLSGASLFGFDALARSASTTRRGAMELGITSGQLQAANITYERIGGAGSLMSLIADIQNDATQQYMLERLGISAQDIQSKNAAELLPDTLAALRRQYLSIPENLRGTLAPSYGLTEFMSLSGLRALGGMSEAELSGLGAQFRGRQGGLEIASETGQRFQDFLAKLEDAGKGLQTSLINRLVELSEPLGNIVDGFTRLVRTGIDSPAFADGVKKFADYMQEFGNWLGSDDPKKTLRDFVTNVSEVVSGLGRMAAWLASWFPATSPANAAERGPGIAEDGSVYGPVAPQPPGVFGTVRRGGGRWQGFTWVPDEPNIQRQSYIPGGAGVWAEQFSALERERNLPPGLLNSIYQAESGGGRNMGPSRAGALGPFQFMPGTAQRFGLTDPMDTAASASAAARYMQSLLTMFGGDVDKAAAAYNWGEGNVQRQIRQYGERWREYLPQETQDYIGKIRRGMGVGTATTSASAGQAVNINITNASGSNTVDIAAGLGAPGYIG